MSNVFTKMANVAKDWVKNADAVTVGKTAAGILIAVGGILVMITTNTAGDDQIVEAVTDAAADAAETVEKVAEAATEVVAEVVEDTTK